MKRAALGLVVGVTALTVSGCAGTVSPLHGTIYTSVQYPSHYTGVQDAGPGSKRGEAEASNILGIVATGDASVTTAAKNGRISKIRTVDAEGTSILGLYSTYKTIVTGD